MLKNYLKIAWRNLLRNKAYSTINILGLAVGMTVAICSGLWVADEFSINKNFKHYDRIVEVMQNSTQGGQTGTYDAVPVPLATELRTKYAGDFKAVAQVSWNGGHILSAGDVQLSREGMNAEPAMLEILAPRMIYGDLTALGKPGAIVINHSLATALFGNANPMNKTIKVDARQLFNVTGVYEDFPYNSSWSSTHMLMSWAPYLADNPGLVSAEADWGSTTWVYAQLQDHADLDRVAAKVKGLMKGRKGRDDKPEVVLQPMSRWHLYNAFENGVNVGGGILFVKMFALIGGFVLLLACINFMNLSTARSERRAKEVGIRKAVGSLRRQLIAQFLGESLLITAIAAVLSLIMLLLVMSGFNRIADKQMTIPWNEPVFWMLIAGFVLLTGLLSGSYPALYLSSFDSIKVLKGHFKAGRVASLPRKILVVLQFTVSVSLIIGTLVVYLQIRHGYERPTGYDRHGLVTMYRSTPEMHTNYPVIRDELMRGGAITDIALSSAPTTEIDHGGNFDWPGRDPNTPNGLGVVAVTQEFGKIVKWQIKEGRDFSRDFHSDSSGLVLNEAAVKWMGLQHPVGTTIKYLSSTHKDKNFLVIGVIRDMVMESPFSTIAPIVYSLDTASINSEWVTMRLNPSMSEQKAAALIGPVFKRFNPGSPFGYRVNDEEYAKNFVLEQRISVLVSILTGFAIFISCLGLFGLASFMAEQRNKEIGIRKVLGASVLHLWGLLSKEFLLLVSLSFFVAVPLSYFAMHSWLQHYDYRIGLSFWIFLVTMAGALLITLATVSVQSVRASLVNPTKSLRAE